MGPNPESKGYRQADFRSTDHRTSRGANRLRAGAAPPVVPEHTLVEVPNPEIASGRGENVFDAIADGAGSHDRTGPVYDDGVDVRTLGAPTAARTNEKHSSIRKGLNHRVCQAEVADRNERNQLRPVRCDPHIDRLSGSRIRKDRAPCSRCHRPKFPPSVGPDHTTTASPAGPTPTDTTPSEG